MQVVIEEKTMVPTVVVGIGGTGAEVLTRVRRLIEEIYGDLTQFPIISFLWIDTDKEYKFTSPEAAGSPFLDYEKYWAKISGNEVREILSHMEGYPWIESWFPQELERNVTAIEAGAGQIRACGRFAFFYNYAKIRDSFNEACNRVKRHEAFMQEQHNVRVIGNALNVFVTGSLSGGTGSGMLIDLGYCLRSWLRGQGNSLITAISPLPNAFAGVKVGDRVLANGYAALMELSYFSDHRTEYLAQFDRDLASEIRDKRPPFDFTYLVGTKNGEAEFDLDQLREMIAQNIFLDLTSDFAPHKRSIRDNIKAAWAQADPSGRGYPKNFMSFGLAAIEVPIAQIRSSLSNRLAKDLISWWLNELVPLPPNMTELIQADFLRPKRFSENELLTDLASGTNKSLMSEISSWVNSLRDEIATEDKLQCTSQMINVFSGEKGKILEFPTYLQTKAEEYSNHHLKETATDERVHGDFLQAMYDNRNRTIQQGRKDLEAEFYAIICDRTKGPKFAAAFVENLRTLLTNASAKYKRESERIWQPNEINRQNQFEGALQDITHFKGAFGLTKQAQMERYAEEALSGLEASYVALIQRKARQVGVEIIESLLEHLERIEQQLTRFNQRLSHIRDEFQQNADRDASRADALKINGAKLYDREELNSLYKDLLERLAGVSESNKSRHELGLDQICHTLSEDILRAASPLWKQNRMADEVMQLFDIPKLPDVNNSFQKLITERTRSVVINAAGDSLLNQNLAACNRLFRTHKNSQDKIRNEIRLAYEKSHPLILLSDGVMMAAGFTPALNAKIAIVGGKTTSDAIARNLLPFLLERVGSEDSITPLGDAERHRIVFVQELGGFSLRCIDGMRELQRSYQDWKGQMIDAKRAQIRGESRDLPIPVHIQKEIPFWDLFPEDSKIFRLIVQARALKILKLEENRNTHDKVIRYVRKTVTSNEAIDIASTWEEAVQVLEVQACRPDREELERQITEKFNAADQPASKKVLYDQLLTYLKQRETELNKVGGTDSPEYKREFTLIEEVITQYKLKITDSHSLPISQTELTPDNDQHIESISAPEPSIQPNTAQFEQYLTDLSNLRLQPDAFIASAKAKAYELEIGLPEAESIWSKFLTLPQSSQKELEYENYLTQLANLKVPREAFLSAAAAKAKELGIGAQSAEAIQSKFV